MTKEKKAVVDAAAAASLRAEYKAAKAHRAELERTLKAETRAIKTQKSEILAALDARRRDVKRETMAEESHIKKAELAMHKTIGKETAVAIRTSEEDIIARNSEVEASSTINRSFGERPVRAPVSTTIAPLLAKAPSRRKIDCAASWAEDKFSWVSVVGVEFVLTAMMNRYR